MSSQTTKMTPLMTEIVDPCHRGDDSTITDDFSDVHLLIAEVFHLKKEAKERNAEIEKLNDIRERLESEIRDLTALLFEVLRRLLRHSDRLE